MGDGREIKPRRRRAPRRVTSPSHPADPPDLGEAPEYPKKRRIAGSQSFTEEEVNWLHQVMMKMLNGGDVSVLRRASAAQSVFRKVQKMKDTVERVKRERGIL